MAVKITAKRKKRLCAAQGEVDLCMVQVKLARSIGLNVQLKETVPDGEKSKTIAFY